MLCSSMMKDIVAHPSDMGPGTFLFAAGMEQESNVAKPVQKSASDLMQDTLNSGGLKTTTLNWKAQHGRQLQRYEQDFGLAAGMV